MNLKPLFQIVFSVFVPFFPLFGKETIGFFVHGIADSGHRQVQSMLKKDDGKPYLLSMPCEYFNFADSTDSFWRINFWLCDLGQENEIAQMHNELEKTRSKYPNAHIVLVGISRGASAIINYCANYPTDKIAACVLESPYDHINSLLEHHHVLKSFGEYARTMLSTIMPKCDLDGMFPRNQIEKIAKDIPMLFVSVHNDRSIPLSSIINLVDLRKKHNHKHVHHLHLFHGKHGNLMSGKDAQMYQDVGHAFFARYDIEHNAEFAKRGETYL